MTKDHKEKHFGGTHVTPTSFSGYIISSFKGWKYFFSFKRHFALLYHNFWLALNLRIIFCNQKKRATAPGHLQVWKKRRKRYNLLKATEIVLLFLLTSLIFGNARQRPWLRSSWTSAQFMVCSIWRLLRGCLETWRKHLYIFLFRNGFPGWVGERGSLFSFNFSQILLREDFLVLGVHLCLRDRNLSDLQSHR